ncbi:hypothetical protein J8J27_32280, partial [Mycobacterium tuberculosis]|nr:hypothetical protein [Mycobacterium tuberculosis]
MAGLGARRPEIGDFGLHIARDLENLAETVAALTPEAIAAAIDLLASSERLWLVGFRNSAALAAYAHGLLAHVRPE